MQSCCCPKNQKWWAKWKVCHLGVGKSDQCFSTTFFWPLDGKTRRFYETFINGVHLLWVIGSSFPISNITPCSRVVTPQTGSRQVLQWGGWRFWSQSDLSLNPAKLLFACSFCFYGYEYLSSRVREGIELGDIWKAPTTLQRLNR